MGVGQPGPLERHRPMRWSFLLALLLPLALAGLAGCGSNRDAPQATTPPGREADAVAPAMEQHTESVQARPTAPPATVTPTVTPPAPLAAVVNGQYVFLADYERRVDQYELALLDQGLDPDTQEGHAQLDQVGPDVLESMIGFVLIEQSAAALGATVSDEELEEKIEADIATGGGQAAFDEWLQATGQTREDYRAILREYMLSQGVLEAVTADVSDTAEQVRARHIVVASEGEAEEIAALLADGADFEMLAQQRSLDVATRDDGGDQGWFPRGLVATEMESAAFSLQPGELSDPFWLGEGYHILQVVEREDARALSPEMLVDLTMSVFERWLDEQRAAAVIERFVGE